MSEVAVRSDCFICIFSQLASSLNFQVFELGSGKTLAVTCLGENKSDDHIVYIV